MKLSKAIRISFFSLILSSLPFGDCFIGHHNQQHQYHHQYLNEISSATTTHSTTILYSSPTESNIEDVVSEWTNRIVNEAKEASSCVSIVASAILLPSEKVMAEDIVKICDTIDTLNKNDDLFVIKTFDLRKRALKAQRYEYLSKLMQKDYDAYIATASFLSPSRIPRKELPNLQDVPIDKNAVPISTASTSLTAEDGSTPLVEDCKLDNMAYQDSPLDKLLLSIFRKLVAQNTGGVTSDKPGIEGLLEQGRTFMLQPGQTPEAQHKMVYDTLGGLMTPVLPPFYRIFMSGIVPKLGTEWDGKQFGPWFYAPFLTSFVTPTFFGFLVGPSYPNRRKDGQLGGLVVEKCKFLVSLYSLGQLFFVVCWYSHTCSHMFSYFHFYSKKVDVRVFVCINVNYQPNNSFRRNWVYHLLYVRIS